METNERNLSAELEYLLKIETLLRQRSAANATLKWLEESGARGALAARMHSVAREVVEGANVQLGLLKDEIQARGA